MCAIGKHNLICTVCGKTFRGRHNGSYCSITCRSTRQKSYTRSITSTEIKHKRIIRQPCIVCGEIKSEAHHSDYNKPFEITWLCRKHHIEWHKTNTSIETMELRLIISRLNT